MKECLAILLALVVMISYSRRQTNKTVIENSNSTLSRREYKIEEKDLENRIRELEHEIRKKEDEIEKQGSSFLPNATPEECARFRNPFKLLQSDKK